ncbi:UNVERIFIED_CONTAM: 5-formyltetrahydrofolate cyclo-ligase [Trichonephila clavipes]
MALQAAKKALRTHLKDVLKSLPAEEKSRQSDIVINKLFQSKKYKESKRISVYLSRDIEVDTRTILANIFSSGKECFIPTYDSKSTSMIMVKLQSLQDFENLPVTSWNIKQPQYSEDLLDALATGIFLSFFQFLILAHTCYIYILFEFSIINKIHFELSC